MRLILSRKGFDSALGGAASPIFPDGAPTTYAQIAKGPETSLGPIVADLTRGAITGATMAHLDPDLAHPALCRAGRVGGLPSGRLGHPPPIWSDAASGLAMCFSSSAGFAPCRGGQTAVGVTNRRRRIAMLCSAGCRLARRS
jgi:hypothetical protein